MSTQPACGLGAGKALGRHQAAEVHGRDAGLAALPPAEGLGRAPEVAWNWP